MRASRLLVVGACLAVLVGGSCSGSSDSEGLPEADETGWPGSGPAPEVLLGVSASQPADEYAGSDLYLLALGAPFEEAALVVQHAFTSTIAVRSITQSDAAPMSPEANTSSTIVLPDGRVLVGWGRIGGGDSEYFAEVGATVVDPASGSTDVAVHLEDGSFQQGDTFVWDPEAETLWLDGGTCFAWDEGAPGSGFSEEPCPPPDAPPDGIGELDDWDFSCCSPFEIIDPDSGEVVFTDDSVVAPTDVGGPLPEVLDQLDGTLLFRVPSAGGSRLLVLSPDGSVAEIGEWESGPVVDAVTLGARLVDGAVLFSQEVTERPSGAALSRYTIDTGVTEVLVEGGHLTWTVVPGERSRVVVWQEPKDRGEEMVTTVWTGDAASGPLDDGAELDHARLSYGEPSFDASTGTVLFTTDRVLEVAGSERRSTRLWRMDPGEEPVEIVTGREIDLLASARSGASLVYTSLPDGCDRAGPECPIRLRRIEPATGAVVDLGEGVWQAWFVDDQDVMVFGRIAATDGPTAPDAEVAATSLDEGDDVRTWYGPDSSPELPEGASLVAVVGSSAEAPIDSLPVCDFGCGGDPIPQPRALFACDFFADTPGC